MVYPGECKMTDGTICEVCDLNESCSSQPFTAKRKCERCKSTAQCEPVQFHGYTLEICEPCYRAAVHIGEVV